MSVFGLKVWSFSAIIYGRKGFTYLDYEINHKAICKIVMQELNFEILGYEKFKINCRGRL